MKPCCLAGLIAWLAVAAGALAGEGPSVQEDPIARALGLRGHRLEVLPPGIEYVQPLADGRVAVVVYDAKWALPTGGPEREADNPGVVWIRVDQGREKAGAPLGRLLVDSRGRAFFYSGAWFPGIRGHLYWFDRGQWHEHRFKPELKPDEVAAYISGIREDSRGRAWLTAGPRAICIDLDNKLREFPLMPDPGVQVGESQLGLAENARGDLLVCLTYALSGGNGSEAVEGPSRAWLFPGGDLAKGRAVELPWTNRTPLALTGSHWGFLGYEKPLVLLSLDPAGAAPVDTLDARLRKLLDQLDDDLWEKREEASERLLREFRSMEAKIKELAGAEKRPEVKGRLDKALELWASGAARDVKTWLGPLAGGERFLDARPVEVRGSAERHLMITGLWLAGQPEPQPKDRAYGWHLVRVTKEDKLQPVVSSGDPGAGPVQGMNLGALPDGRLLCQNMYYDAYDRRGIKVWNGRELADVAEDDFHLQQIARMPWKTDRCGRYYGSRGWSDYWWVYDPKGAPVDAAYKTASFNTCALSRRDSRDSVWHVLTDKWPVNHYPLKGDLVRFEQGEPKRLGEIDLSTKETKNVNFASGGGGDPPLVTPFGPDAAVISFRHRNYLYSAGKLEQFESLVELLKKHRAAVAEGLQAEQKVCRRPWRLVADDAGNLWFLDPAEEKYDSRLKVLTPAGELLVAKNWNPFNTGGLLPAAGGVVAWKSSAQPEWAVLRAGGGVVSVVKVESPARGEDYNYELAFRRADGGAVLGGKILVGADGSSRRIFPAESTKLDQETAGGWQMVCTAFPRRFQGDYRGERHLVRGDLRAELPRAPKLLLGSPASGELFACLLGGMYRVVLEDAGGGAARRVRLDEVVPTGAYQCSMWYHYQSAGEHGACEDFIDRDGRIWQIGRSRVTRIDPPPEVRASLLGKKK